jgi:hypothetical protein
MLKHPLECVVTLMSSDIVHPLFLNLNLQWLVTKNTRREFVLGTCFFGYKPSCAHTLYIYIYIDLHMSIFFLLYVIFGPSCVYIFFSFHNLIQDYLCKIQKVVWKRNIR